MVICLERGADLHMAQLMPLPLTISCFSKIQIGFTFLVLAYLSSPGKGPLNGRVCVCVCVCYLNCPHTDKSSRIYLESVLAGESGACSPMSSENPPTGRRHVPVTNCRSRVLFSLSSSRTNCKRSHTHTHKFFNAFLHDNTHCGGCY